MSSFYDLASARRSIRKYEDRDIPAGDVEYFIKAAVCAPSGCNSQCWRFIAIKDRTVINRIAQVVISKIEEILDDKKEELTEQYLVSKRKMVSFFVNAPLVIAVFMTHMEYYDPLMTAALQEQGYDHEGMMKLFAWPDLLSIGAAVQNLLLAVHEKGYGACWMNEPAIAGVEIGKILDIPREHKFISLIPVGYPAYTPKEKKIKGLDEIFTYIGE